MRKVELIKISYKIKDRSILRKINLVVNEGEMIAITGPSGSGKTTLVNILGLIEKASSGSIVIGGKEIKNSSDKSKILKNQISFIFQNYALIENKSVKFNVAISDNFFARRNKFKKVLKSLEIVGLNKNYINRKVASLSGGEQQRVAIARAIYRDSELIIADEPTGNLDSENALNVLSIFKEMQNQGKTIIIVTHENRFDNFFDKIYQIKDGHIKKIS